VLVVPSERQMTEITQEFQAFIVRFCRVLPLRAWETR
jgi:hypothetical protein